MDNKEDIQPLLNTIKNDGSKNTTVSEASIFENIQGQRHKQRQKIFWFSVGCVSLHFVMFIILFIYLLFCKKSDIPPYFIYVVTVVVPLHSYGVLKIITRSLWDDRNYSEVLGMEHLITASKKKKPAYGGSDADSE